MNQDSLEYFFGAARSVSSSNPSCHAFAAAYKTLLLNNLISSNAPGSNCEDFVETSLTSYKNLFQNSQDDSVKDFSNYEFSVSLPVQISNLPINVNYLRGQVQTYIAGYILKKLNKTVFKNCHHCLKQLCANKVTNEHNLISARDYNTQRLSLKYPSSVFGSLVQKIVSYIGQQIPTICHHINIRKTLCDNINNNFDFKNISLCSNHGDNLEIKIIQNIVHLMVNYWCTEVNRILLGRKTLHPKETDPMKLKANFWYIKHSKKKKTPQGKFNYIQSI